MYYNFAMWIIDTFEIQNVSSGAVESEVWVVIQRMTLVTLPTIMFFRFHAFVFCIELEKKREEKLIISMLSLNAWLLLACVKYWIF